MTAAPLILVVDDDWAIRSNTTELLEMSGHRVSAHADAGAALAWCRSHPDAASAAIIDLSLPDMAGTALLRALHELAPGLPVIIATGSAGEETLLALRGLPLAGLLRKPVRASQVLDTVAAALAKARP